MGTRSFRRARMAFATVAVAGVTLLGAAPAWATGAETAAAEVTVIPRWEGDFYLWEGYDHFGSWYGYRIVEDIGYTGHYVNEPLKVLAGIQRENPTSPPLPKELPPAMPTIRMSIPMPGTTGEIRSMNGECLYQTYSAPAALLPTPCGAEKGAWEVTHDGVIKDADTGENLVMDTIWADYDVSPDRWYYVGPNAIDAGALGVGGYDRRNSRFSVRFENMSQVPGDERFTATTGVDTEGRLVLRGTGTPGTSVAWPSVGSQWTIVKTTVDADGAWEIVPNTTGSAGFTEYTVRHFGAGFSDSVATLTMNSEPLSIPIVDWRIAAPAAGLLVLATPRSARDTPHTTGAINPPVPLLRRRRTFERSNSMRRQSARVLRRAEMFTWTYRHARTLPVTATKIRIQAANGTFKPWEGNTITSMATARITAHEATPE